MSKILVVDDAVDILNLLSTVLNMHGHEVGVASSRSGLLNQLKLFKPDLIILGVMLAGEDGRSICKEIKTMHNKKIPIMLYSENPDTLDTYKDSQADDAIEKPFNIKIILEKIDHLLYLYKK